MTRLMSGVFALVALVAGGYAVMGWQGSAPALPENLLVGSANAQEAAEVDTSTIIEMVQGAEDAPITLDEYASFTCPHCAPFHEGPYKQLKADFIDTGKVRFIFREVYFDRYGLWASMVARCSGPEKFFGMTDRIMKGQSDWARAGSATDIVDKLRKIGRLAGIESDQLEACLMDSTKAQTLVTWYQENATADGVESTPSFVMNGKKVENQPYDDFKVITLVRNDSGNRTASFSVVTNWAFSDLASFSNRDSRAADSFWWSSRASDLRISAPRPRSVAKNFSGWPIPAKARTRVDAHGIPVCRGSNLPEQ